MAQKIQQNYSAKTKIRRRNNLRPLNIRKKLGPKSAFLGTRKKKRGQG
jgi:hypothetical protein